ncbi:MAG: SigE family RNA polymerase sigma factor [Micrococcales bacterium]|nr:SigE family RNA polymerase sigma factor [Micrococcales bacterium]
MSATDFALSGTATVRATSRDAQFTAFMTENLTRLTRTAWLLTGDQHHADDLVQHALVRTYTAWSRASRTDPLAYTRKVMANRRIDLWRSRRREVLVPPEDVPDAGGCDRSMLAERDLLVAALATLRPRQRCVVVLRYVEGLSEREVAATLAIPVGTVKSDASRGLSRMRTALSQT